MVVHPNIIRILHVYETTASLYLVLELATGGELFEEIIAQVRHLRNGCVCSCVCLCEKGSGDGGDGRAPLVALEVVREAIVQGSWLGLGDGCGWVG